MKHCFGALRRQSRRDAVWGEPRVQGVRQRAQYLYRFSFVLLTLANRQIFLCSWVLLPQCRLEANYAHQQELDMIPLMMQENYRPQGWREFQR